VTGPPPEPSGPWPANTALYFSVGERLTLRLKGGDTVTGTITARAPERVWIVGDGGTFVVWTGAILGITHHEIREQRLAAMHENAT
jgi:hypothetical protein